MSRFFGFVFCKSRSILTATQKLDWGCKWLIFSILCICSWLMFLFLKIWLYVHCTQQLLCRNHEFKQSLSDIPKWGRNITKLLFCQHFDACHLSVSMKKKKVEKKNKGCVNNFAKKNTCWAYFFVADPQKYANIEQYCFAVDTVIVFV